MGYGTLRNETKRNGTLRNGTLRNGTLRNGTLRNGTLRNGTLVELTSTNPLARSLIWLHSCCHSCCHRQHGFDRSSWCSLLPSSNGISPLSGGPLLIGRLIHQKERKLRKVPFSFVSQSAVQCVQWTRIQSHLLGAWMPE